MDKLTLSELYLGNTDAASELVFSSDDDRLLFEQTYFTPCHLDADEFLEGKRFFATGPRGAGKTALLRYLEIQAKQRLETETLFLLFKSGTAEEDRLRAERRHSSLRLIKLSGDDFSNNEREHILRWFFHCQLASILMKSTKAIVNREANFAQYINYVLRGQDLESVDLTKLTSNSTDSLVKDNIAWNTISDRTFIPEVVNAADKLLAELTPKRGSLYIFVDVAERGRWSRDVHLFRDLIAIAYRLNTLTLKGPRWFKLICAIPSETLSRLADGGLVLDPGGELEWCVGISRERLHPLLEMICFKIRQVETGAGIRHQDGSLALIWRRYFRALGPGRHAVTTSRDEQGRKTAELNQGFLLNLTWFRPRDIVRLLTLVQARFPKDRGFTDHGILSIIHAYSRCAWEDRVDDLSAMYTARELAALRTIFLGFKSIFSFDQLCVRIEMLRKESPGLQDLLENHPITEIIRDLYRAGVVGNRVAESYRFASRGDAQISFRLPLAVHQGLRSHFSDDRWLR